MTHTKQVTRKRQHCQVMQTEEQYDVNKKIKEEHKQPIKIEWINNESTSIQFKGHLSQTLVLIKNRFEEIVIENGGIPISNWFTFSNYCELLTLCTPILSEKYMKEIHDIHNKYRTLSIDGTLWESKAQMALANFLISRGIIPTKGTIYPKEFKEKFGVDSEYDLHFTVNDKTYDIELDMHRLTFTSDIDYNTKKENRRLFNESNPNFIKLHKNDCKDDYKLMKILNNIIPNIHQMKVVPFNNSLYSNIQVSRWNILDQTLDKCMFIKSKMNHIPSFEWMYRKGIYKSRPKETWEEYINTNILSRHIQLCGGLDIINELLKCN
jgi:hypothetical protein